MVPLSPYLSESQRTESSEGLAEDNDGALSLCLSESKRTESSEGSAEHNDDELI